MGPPSVVVGRVLVQDRPQMPLAEDQYPVSDLGPGGGTLRRELLDRMLILSAAHLRAVLIEYQARYNTGRPHQGIAQRVPGYECEAPSVIAVNLDVQRIRRKPVLSGLINEYSRAA